ncbi:MAG: aspartate aminotransferase family protein [Hyphomicrobiaceae bacterium]
MSSDTARRNATIDEALLETEQRYASANPKSFARHLAAGKHLPGGNTRTNMYFSPFPVAIARGEGARLHDLDGHAYADFLGEYTAGIFGHSHPRIRAAIVEALDGGLNLGGPNRWEAELGRLMCERFPSLEKVRFCNSGTEANLYAVTAARACTGRTHILAFDGAYHGGLLSFVSSNPMLAPFPFVIGQYNDLEECAALIARHCHELAAALIEPMVGSGGGISADRAFLAMLREESKRHGFVLIFDEVMTSRLAPGGLQSKLGIVPDMTSFGKYLGGGMSFGAFGGADWIMSRFDPAAGGSFVHSGTYNNNSLTMAAGVAGLRDVYTPEACADLNSRGDRLRDRLNATFQQRGVAMQMLGQGSLNVIHMHRRALRRPTDVVSDPKRQALFHLEMLERGFFLSRRGLSALCLPLTDKDVDGFVEAVDDFCAIYRPLLLDDAA